MLYSRDVFRILEIEPTDDKKAIKKAYAKLVKQYHPEEYPEKWKDIHDAYETALKMAERTAVSSSTIHKQTENVKTEQNRPVLQTETEKKPSVLETKTESTPPVMHIKKESISLSPPPKTKITKFEHMQNQEGEDFETAEIEDLFEQIGQLSAEQEKQREELQKQKMQRVMSRFKTMARKRRCNRKEWEKFFQQKDILPIISTREFLYQLGECFADRKIDDEMYRMLKGQLQLIDEYLMSKGIVFKNLALFNPVEYAESKIDDAYKAGLHHGIKIKFESKILLSPPVIFLVVFVLMIVIGCTLSGHNENVVVEEEYQYLQKVSLTDNNDIACNVFILENYYVSGSCIYVSRSGVYMSIEPEYLFKEKDKWINQRIEYENKYKNDTSEYYRNLSVGEIVPMKNFDDAEYVTIYYDWIGSQWEESDPNILVYGYFVHDEEDSIIEEVTIILHLSPSDYDETTDEILKELEKAYGFDLHEYYSSNFP